jgi:hypothetical protein
MVHTLARTGSAAAGAAVDILREKACPVAWRDTILDLIVIAIALATATTTNTDLLMMRRSSTHHEFQQTVGAV